MLSIVVLEIAAFIVQKLSQIAPICSSPVASAMLTAKQVAGEGMGAATNRRRRRRLMSTGADLGDGTGGGPDG